MYVCMYGMDVCMYAIAEVQHSMSLCDDYDYYDSELYTNVEYTLGLITHISSHRVISPRS